jgi:polygalacturonase
MSRLISHQLLRALPIALLILPGSGFSAGSGRQLFNIADYGAKKDGSALATQAFQQAIAAAKAAGGGVIYVPPGKYLSCPVELFSNMTLDIDAGATIEFPVAPLPFRRAGTWGLRRWLRCRLSGDTTSRMSRSPDAARSPPAILKHGERRTKTPMKPT